MNRGIDPPELQGAPTDAYWRLARSGEPSGELSAPQTLGGELHPFASVAERSAPDVYLASIPDAEFRWPDRGLVAFDGSGRQVIPEDPGIVEPEAGEATRPRRLPGVVFDLTAPGSLQYSHFLCDALPKLHLLEAAGVALDEVDTFVVTTARRGFHRDLLGMLGIGPERILGRLRTRGATHTAEALHAVSRVRRGLWTPAWAAEFLRRLVGVPRAAEAATTAGQRYYISRADAKRRVVRNEDEVRDALAEFGFKPILASDFGVREFAQRLAAAECIAGPHGAGLANALFAPPGCKVIELYSWHVMAEFWLLSQRMGHLHHMLACAGPDGTMAEAARARPFRERNHADLVVDVERLRRLVSTALGE